MRLDDEDSIEPSPSKNSCDKTPFDEPNLEYGEKVGSPKKNPENEKYWNTQHMDDFNADELLKELLK